MFNIVKQNIVISLRTDSFKILAVLALLLVFSAWLASGFSARQPSSVFLDFGFSSLRILLCFMALAWLQELFIRPIERRYISQLLAFPLPRYQLFLLNYAVVAMLLLLAVVCAAILLWVAVSLGVSYEQVSPLGLAYEYMLVWVFIYLDLLVVLAFTSLVGCVATTANLSVFFGLGFFVIAHAIGPVIAYLTMSASVDEAQQTYILPVLQIVQYIIPDLNALDVRDWVIYGMAPPLLEVFYKAAMAVAYIACILWLAIGVFNKREFP